VGSIHCGLTEICSPGIAMKAMDGFYHERGVADTNFRCLSGSSKISLGREKLDRVKKLLRTAEK